jgi:hypothetical protein
VRSSLYRSRRDGPDTLYMQYFFYAADATIIAYPDFRCYRDAGGTYHDVNLHYNVVG